MELAVLRVCWARGTTALYVVWDHVRGHFQESIVYVKCIPFFLMGSNQCEFISCAFVYI